MPTLTDEDRATVESYCSSFGPPDYLSPLAAKLYVAGLRAGMERAAKVCDTEYAADVCAKAIRAAINAE